MAAKKNLSPAIKKQFLNRCKVIAKHWARAVLLTAFSGACGKVNAIDPATTNPVDPNSINAKDGSGSINSKSSPLGEVNASALTIYPLVYMAASGKISNIERPAIDPTTVAPAAEIAVSNLPLCSGVTPAGPFYILTLFLTQTASDGATQISPQLGTYAIVASDQAKPQSSRQSARASLTVYDDPTPCAHDEYTAGAYCGASLSPQILGGTVTITRIVLPSTDDEGSIEGSFSDVKYDSYNGEAAVTNGRFNTSACSIDLQPYSNLAVPL